MLLSSMVASVKTHSTVLSLPLWKKLPPLCVVVMQGVVHVVQEVVVLRAVPPAALLALVVLLCQRLGNIVAAQLLLCFSFLACTISVRHRTALPICQLTIAFDWVLLQNFLLQLTQLTFLAACRKKSILVYVTPTVRKASPLPDAVEA